MTFAENLTRIMAERELTPSHVVVALLAHGVTVGPWAVARWMDGSHCPRGKDLPAVAAALGISTDELFAPEPAP